MFNLVEKIYISLNIIKFSSVVFFLGNQFHLHEIYGLLSLLSRLLPNKPLWRDIDKYVLFIFSCPSFITILQKYVEPIII